MLPPARRALFSFMRGSVEPEVPTSPVSVSAEGAVVKSCRRFFASCFALMRCTARRTRAMARFVGRPCTSSTSSNSDSKDAWDCRSKGGSKRCSLACSRSFDTASATRSTRAARASPLLEASSSSALARLRISSMLRSESPLNVVPDMRLETAPSAMSAARRRLMATFTCALGCPDSAAFSSQSFRCFCTSAARDESLAPDALERVSSRCCSASIPAVDSTAMFQQARPSPASAASLSMRTTSLDASLFRRLAAALAPGPRFSMSGISASS
mmetsp:Transcript_4649/g.13239  ORF Transcript_4649/g.13239 Transcript_4649/m.13239 type:complete len:271 (+) Transcript_4649:32-844(+)